MNEMVLARLWLIVPNPLGWSLASIQRRGGRGEGVVSGRVRCEAKSSLARVAVQTFNVQRSTDDRQIDTHPPLFTGSDFSPYVIAMATMPAAPSYPCSTLAEHPSGVVREVSRD